MKGIINGKIFQKDQFISDSVLLYDQHIQEILPRGEVDLLTLDEVLDAEGHMVLPGFIDVHVHGYHGFDTMDDTDEAIMDISRRLLENGVTAFLPTTMTMPKEDIEKALNRIRKMMSKDHEGATVLGAHLEGPFINSKYKGAQNAGHILLPDEEWLENYLDVIKIITIAPEETGAMEFIKSLSQKNITLSIGHTGADYKTAMAAIAAGAKGVTHLFNAMTGLHHRQPGVVGAVYNSDCYCEIIADLIHIHPALFSVVEKVKRPERILLITDCMRAGGLVDGIYELGGQKVLSHEGRCTLEDGTLAGSVLRLNQGVKHFYENTTLSLEKVIPMASEYPARYIGVWEERGSLEQGKFADILIADASLDIVYTIKEGRLLYEKENKRHDHSDL